MTLNYALCRVWYHEIKNLFFSTKLNYYFFISLSSLHTTMIFFCRMLNSIPSANQNRIFERAFNYKNIFIYQEEELFRILSSPNLIVGAFATLFFSFTSFYCIITCETSFFVSYQETMTNAFLSDFV